MRTSIDPSPRTAFVALILICLMLGIPARGDTATPLCVAVSIAPQAYVAKKIGGDRVRVSVVLPPGQSPHTFEPTPRTAKMLAESGLFFRIGTSFEATLAGKIPSESKTRMVDSAKSVALLDETHDAHIWMDPRRMKVVAANMAAAMRSADPAGSTVYAAGLDALHRELDELDAAIRARLAPHAGKRIYVFHAAYAYFCDAYGLRQVALEEDGKEPSPRRLARLVDQAKADGVTTVFSEPQSSEKSARALAAAVGAKIVSLDPLGADYPANMKHIADAIALALAEQSS
ncbi:MAG: zinc ABC transporter substrate-binding protein [Deltaproteobacteria bacterium]|nr:zinc ABC transporter substrate-binding protein [Deltaproteobacteria bacterium]